MIKCWGTTRLDKGGIHDSRHQKRANDLECVNPMQVHESCACDLVAERHFECVNPAEMRECIIRDIIAAVHMERVNPM